MMVERVTVREVGLRDGLQLVDAFVPTGVKIDWCRAQAAVGFSQIEVTSFVPPSVIGQFCDAAEVLGAANRIDGLCPSVLVPNLKGGLKALEGGAGKITFVLSASEAHNLSNVRKSSEASLGEFRALIEARDEHPEAGRAEIGAVIATAFGCSIQGEVPEARVCEVARALVEAGAGEVNIADTVGYANPVQVRRLFESLAGLAGQTPLAAHFHDTRAMGLANVVAAAQAGVRRFDAALGGLGGCPFAPGATGNIATEDCVYLLESIGFSTGIDLSGLLDVRRRLDDWLAGERIGGRLMKAGPAKTFRPAV